MKSKTRGKRDRVELPRDIRCNRFVGTFPVDGGVNMYNQQRSLAMNTVTEGPLKHAANVYILPASITNPQYYPHVAYLREMALIHPDRLDSPP